MIIDIRGNLRRYVSLNPGFEAACDYLEKENLGDLKPGRHVIDETADVVALVTKETAIPDEQPRLEAHKKHIDIQYILTGEHRIGWLPTTECRHISKPYEAEHDIIFYADSPRFETVLPPHHFAILFPEDAHAPVPVDGCIHKVVFKVPVNS